MYFFSDFQYRFRSSRSTADLLRFVSDRIVRAFNRSRATWAVELDIFKAFDRVWHAGLLHKHKSYGISGPIFGLISSFLSNRRFRVVLERMSLQEVLLTLEFLNSPFMVLHFSYCTLMTFVMMLSVILLSVLMILLSTLSLIRHSDLWKYLELAAQLESDLRDTVDWAGNNLLILMLEKLSRFCFTGLITLVLLMWKWMGLVLRKNHIFRFWVWLFVLNWIGALTLCLLLKLPPKKLWPWFVPLSFFLLRLLCISINLPYGQAWNTVVISGLVLLVVTWNC